MMAVIFEVWPAGGKREDYLQMAASLRQELKTIDGFISVERFESLYEEGKLLSLSFWRDEAAIARWRNHVHHRHAQTKGRAGMLANYRLRVADVMRDYSMHNRAEAPADALDKVNLPHPGE